METQSIQSKKGDVLSPLVITPEQLLQHWQGHRRLTRKVIEAFPEDEFYNYSIGGMRPFAELAMEMISMADPGITGIVTREWPTADETFSRSAPSTKKEFLQRWDEVTEKLNTLWPQIPPHRFQETDVAFGLYEGTGFFTIFYWIENEVHHRGQGYVYLRSLGIEPPAFWDR